MESKLYKDVYQAELSRDKGTRYPNGGLTFQYRNRLLLPEYFASDCDCSVYCNGKDFAAIFGRRRSNTKYKSIPPVVKVTNPRTRLSIHRIYRMYPSEYKIKEEHCVLTYQSLLELINNNNDMNRLDRVLLSKGSLWKYYWHHPFHATRISMHLGVYSMLIGLLSLVISLLK